ncbi:MAG: DNA gyrase subunit A [Caldilineaceae bacterium]|nr:DNA gyrase subunit A [Caldilineaceae bacterium]
MPIDITDTMQDAYLDYAMSVIVSRALPDVRDGLKPVHRRILYAMFRDLNLTHDKPHKKSARIVGEVLGKYHPHGDTAVYDSMVRMAQDFSLRYMLVDGQGNFGSIDGDNAAAMRYTEARLAEISNLMLEDLEKDTVDWHDNFDNSLREPDILPAALPNLLINGSSGIAVGMATNIPPHNLGEVVDALCYMIDRYDKLDDINAEQLTHIIKGPDFPTGGILYRYRQDKKGEDETDVVIQGYSVGKARMILQAKAHFEEMSRNRRRIVVTELPYQTNKTSLIERIAGLARDGKIEGITDLRDESDRTGMRIVIELTRNVDPKEVLANLFKYTPLQQTFGMQMLALVDGQPRLLGLKRVLHLFIQHREEIIRRRSEYELARARARAHILEGLLKALDILDEVIDTIRRSQRVETARTNLMRNFGFTEVQAQAILDMQLRRLAALERKKLEDEHKELLKRIKYLEDLLAHPEKVLGVIKENLLELKEKYGDARRTQIVDRTKGTLTTTDLLPEQDVWVSVAADGGLQRQDRTRVTATAMKQGVQGGQVALLAANTRDFLYLIDEQGQCRRISIHELPHDGKSKHLAELSDFSRRDNVSAAFSLPRTNGEEKSGYLFFVTAKGMVKRVAKQDFLQAAALDPVIMNVDAKDRLCAAFATTGDQEVMLVHSGGKAIRFDENDVRSMGLAAGGVGGMKLGKGEEIIYAGVVDPTGELITMTEKGYGKRSSLSDYPTQGRNGGGVVTHKPNSKTGRVSAALVLGSTAKPEEPVGLVSRKNKVTVLTVSDIPQMGRGVQGKEIMAVGMGDTVAAIRVLDEPDGGGDGPDGGDSDEVGAKTLSKTTAKNTATTTSASAGPNKPQAGAAGKTKKPAPRKKAASKAGQANADAGTSAAATKSKTRPNSKSPPATRSRVKPAATSSSAAKPSGAKSSGARSSSAKPASAKTKQKPAKQKATAAGTARKSSAAKPASGRTAGKSKASTPSSPATKTHKPKTATSRIKEEAGKKPARKTTASQSSKKQPTSPQSTAPSSPAAKTKTPSAPAKKKSNKLKAVASVPKSQRSST